MNNDDKRLPIGLGIVLLLIVVVYVPIGASIATDYVAHWMGWWK